MKTDDRITLDFLSSFALLSYRAEQKKRRDAILRQFVEKDKILRRASDLNIDAQEHLPARIRREQCSK